MNRILVDGRWQEKLARWQLHDADKLAGLAPPLPLLTRPHVFVTPGQLSSLHAPPVHCFVKQYAFPSPSWCYGWRPSKARREFANYAVFEQLGIPCAERVACAEWRDALGRLTRALIVTVAVPHSQTLLEYWRGQPPRAERLAVRRQLATLVRRLHDAHFYHHDLVWRNILVQRSPGQPPRLFWIDCPHGSYSHWPPVRRRYRALRDIALLDLAGRQFCSRAFRLGFLLEYFGQSRATAPVRQALHAINRWHQHKPAKKSIS